MKPEAKRIYSDPDKTLEPYYVLRKGSQKQVCQNLSGLPEMHLPFFSLVNSNVDSDDVLDNLSKGWLVSYPSSAPHDQPVKEAQIDDCKMLKDEQRASNRL